MIVKGIIESVIDKEHLKVRIPFLNGLKAQVDSTPTVDLPDSVICQMPGVNIEVSVGDVVWIAFENSRWELPVIIGFLDVESKIKSKISYKADDIEVQTKAKLPANTSIGNATAQAISCLEGLEINLGDYMRNTMPLYNLDLTDYSVGDRIPAEILAAIPDNAMIIATALSDSGSIQYYPLVEKTKIKQTDDSFSNELINVPQYNYVFANMYGVINITGQVIQ